MPRSISLFLVILVASACGRAPANEMAFLAGFRHTKAIDPDGEASYRIYGDPATIRAAIPNAAAAPVEATPQGTLISFHLPSGKHASLIFSTKPGLPCHLNVAAEPTPALFR